MFSSWSDWKIVFHTKSWAKSTLRFSFRNLNFPNRQKSADFCHLPAYTDGAFQWLVKRHRKFFISKTRSEVRWLIHHFKAFMLKKKTTLLYFSLKSIRIVFQVAGPFERNYKFSCSCWLGISQLRFSIISFDLEKSNSRKWSVSRIFFPFTLQGSNTAVIFCIISNWIVD